MGVASKGGLFGRGKVIWLVVGLGLCAAAARGLVDASRAADVAAITCADFFAQPPEAGALRLSGCATPPAETTVEGVAGQNVTTAYLPLVPADAAVLPSSFRLVLAVDGEQFADLGLSGGRDLAELPVVQGMLERADEGLVEANRRSRRPRWSSARTSSPAWPFPSDWGWLACWCSAWARSAWSVVAARRPAAARHHGPPRRRRVRPLHSRRPPSIAPASAPSPTTPGCVQRASSSGSRRAATPSRCSPVSTWGCAWASGSASAARAARASPHCCTSSGPWTDRLAGTGYEFDGRDVFAATGP